MIQQPSNHCLTFSCFYTFLLNFLPMILERNLLFAQERISLISTWFLNYIIIYDSLFVFLFRATQLHLFMESSPNILIAPKSFMAIHQSLEGGRRRLISWEEIQSSFPFLYKAISFKFCCCIMLEERMDTLAHFFMDHCIRITIIKIRRRTNVVNFIHL